MDADSFFENYITLESRWKDFVSKEITNSNSSALGMTALRICHYVVKHPSCALKEVAISLDISLGSASQMVQSIADNGLLKCAANRDDRRRISISPLPVLINFFAKLL
ncbi:MAG: MarR family transcriptional regulator [Lentisphaeria bacterium]|nr:MarR family transcriptional regulator [Lentisphaeria bacterium]